MSNKINNVFQEFYFENTISAFARRLENVRKFLNLRNPPITGWNKKLTVNVSQQHPPPTFK